MYFCLGFRILLRIESTTGIQEYNNITYCATKFPFIFTIHKYECYGIWPYKFTPLTSIISTTSICTFSNSYFTYWMMFIAKIYLLTSCTSEMNTIPPTPKKLDVNPDTQTLHRHLWCRRPLTIIDPEFDFDTKGCTTCIRVVWFSIIQRLWRLSANTPWINKCLITRLQCPVQRHCDLPQVQILSKHQNYLHTKPRLSETFHCQCFVVIEGGIYIAMYGIRIT